MSVENPAVTSGIRERRHLPQNSRVAVVGAGISGLAFAYYLSWFRQDVKITIYEKSDRTGGYIHSQESPEVASILSSNDEKLVSGGTHVENQWAILEKGPRTLRGTSPGSLMMVDLFKKCGKLDEVYGVTRFSTANRKYLLDIDDNLVEVPPGQGFKTFYNFFFKNNLITRNALFNILKEPFRKVRRAASDKDDESVEMFLNRRFGVGLSDNIASAIFNGIYAGDVGKLSAKSVIKNMYNVEKQQNSSLIVRGLKMLFKLIWSGVLNKFVFFYDKIKYFENTVHYKMISFDESELLNNYQVYHSSSNLKLLKKIVLNFPVICFKYGMQSVTKLLTDQVLKNPNVEIIYNAEITHISKTKASNKVNITIKQSLDSLKEIQYDFVNFSIAPNVLSQLIATDEHTPKLKSLLQKPTYSRVMLVNVYIPGNDYLVDNPGFGYLIPKRYNKDVDANNDILGVIFDSDIEKHRVAVFSSNTVGDSNNESILSMLQKFDSDVISYKKWIKNKDKKALYSVDKEIADWNIRKLINTTISQQKAVVKNQLDCNFEDMLDYTKLTVMMGGHYWSGEADIPSSEGAITKAKTALKKHLHIDLDGIAASGIEPITETKLTDGGIPQYNVGYEQLKSEILEEVDNYFGSESVVLTGMNFNGGIGVPDCISNAFENAFNLSGIDA